MRVVQDMHENSETVREADMVWTYAEKGEWIGGKEEEVKDDPWMW